MGMYALGILPLIKELDNICKQVWYADDAAACGKLHQLKMWWERIILLGPGYNANPSKTWLVVKPQHYSLTMEIFSDTGVNITCEGKRCLGSAIGTTSFIDAYVQSKVTQWVGWLRCHITFSLIQSAIMCLRGSRSSKRNMLCGQPDSVDLVFCEDRVAHGD